MRRVCRRDRRRAQWVLSLPKCLRYFLHHEPALIGPVLRIFLEAVEDRLKARSLGASMEARCASGARMGGGFPIPL